MGWNGKMQIACPFRKHPHDVFVDADIVIHETRAAIGELLAGNDLASARDCDRFIGMVERDLYGNAIEVETRHLTIDAQRPVGIDEASGQRATRMLESEVGTSLDFGARQRRDAGHAPFAKGEACGVQKAGDDAQRVDSAVEPRASEALGRGNDRTVPEVGVVEAAAERR